MISGNGRFRWLRANGASGPAASAAAGEGTGGGGDAPVSGPVQACLVGRCRRASCAWGYCADGAVVVPGLLPAGFRCGRRVRQWWTGAASREVGVAFLGGLAVAGSHRGGDLGPGRPAAAGGLDECEFAVLEFGCQFPGCRDRGEGGRRVHAAAQAVPLMPARAVAAAVSSPAGSLSWCPGGSPPGWRPPVADVRAARVLPFAPSVSGGMAGVLVTGPGG